jgi:trehalose synthase
VNSTKLGGGVAEMLIRIVPLMQELGVDTRWDVIRGHDEFFAVTKAMHNALQGSANQITQESCRVYRECNESNAKKLDLGGDIVVIHDPQPAALIEHRKDGGKWIWRCHIDVAHPQRRAWSLLKEIVEKYDAAVFSLPIFAQKLTIPQFLIYPSIDPLADKNRDIPPEEVDAIVERLGIPRDLPLVVQVSRFDRFKDPVGVIRAIRLVRKRVPCRLVLVGGGASDDPEGMDVLREVHEVAGDDSLIHVLELPPDSHLEINALQRAADIIVQKSLKEGFGLTVAEGMWKGKPVVGAPAGGITAQIIQGETGLLARSVEGAAFKIRTLLGKPRLREALGEAAREYVRRNFLITRHVRDYLSLMIFLRERASP